MPSVPATPVSRRLKSGVKVFKMYVLPGSTLKGTYCEPRLAFEGLAIQSNKLNPLQLNGKSISDLHHSESH